MFAALFTVEIIKIKKRNLNSRVDLYEIETRPDTRVMFDDN
jgi:hypothetical protein